MKKKYQVCLVALVLFLILFGNCKSAFATIYEIDDSEFDKYKKESDTHSSWMIPRNIPRCDLQEYRHLNPIYGQKLEERDGKLYFSFKMAYASCRPYDNYKGYIVTPYYDNYLPRVVLAPVPLSELDTDVNVFRKFFDIQINPMLEKNVVKSFLSGYYDIELIFDVDKLFKLSNNSDFEVDRRYFEYYFKVGLNIEFTWFLAFRKNVYGNIDVLFLSEI